MQRFLLVCGAGAIGCGARYLVGLWAGDKLGTNLPYGTLIVNVIGCFLIALVLTLSIRIATFPPNLKLALTTGFLGGLTTYSAFNAEATELLTGGQLLRGAMYLGLTLIACFLAGGLGILVGKQFGS